jgi:hypothetical protein
VQIYAGNTKPELVVTLTQRDEDDDVDVPLALSTATNVEVIGRINGEIVVDHDLSDGVTVNDDGQITMEWEPGDTDELGVLTLEVLITWPDGPQTVMLDETVEIRAVPQTALVSLDELIDHMSGVTLTERQRQAGQRVIDGCVRGLERRLHRRFRAGTYTETVVGDEIGWAPLAASPVLSVTSVDGMAMPSLYPWQATPNGIWVGVGIRATVVYEAGYATDFDEYADVKLAVLEKCAGVMTVRHDDTLSVKELDTGDDVEAATRVAATWSDDDIWPFMGLKRRVVV